MGLRSTPPRRVLKAAVRRAEPGLEPQDVSSARASETARATAGRLAVATAQRIFSSTPVDRRPLRVLEVGAAVGA